MNFFTYLTYRIGARQAEKAIYKGADKLKNVKFKGQYPTSLTAASGILMATGLICCYGALALFEYSRFYWIVILIGVLMAIDLIFTKHTFSLKEAPHKVNDNRYKEGFRIETKIEPDKGNLILLEKKYRVLNWIQAAFILAGVGAIIYFHFFFELK